jgi:GMP synthase-like glutamine amidotransferase
MIWIFRHSLRDPAGSNYNYLNQRGLAYREHLWGHDPNPPLPTEVSWAIFLGGPQNVDEELHYPWLAQEKQWIQTYLQLGRPYLGICLGGQLVAEVLGAKVQRHVHSEVGWQPMQLQPQAHPLVSHSPLQMQVFQFHSYCFETPPDCVPFASNHITPNQGFVYKDHVVGLQFHPESDAKWIQVCTLKKPYPVGPHVQSPETICQATAALLPPMTQWYYQLLDKLAALSKA